METDYKEVQQNGNTYPDPPKYSEIFKHENNIAQDLHHIPEPKVYNGQATTIIMQPVKLTLF